MKELHFQKTGKMLVAVEGPHRYVLRQNGKAWAAEVYEREGRRTPKLAGNFLSRAQAIDWIGRYRKPDDEAAA